MVSGWQRIVENMISRVTGPMHLRLLLQPAVAIFLGVKDGIKDAQEGRPAYLWTICTNAESRVELLQSGMRKVAKVMIMALIVDAIFQIIELHWFYPEEAVLVALVLAFIPYLLIRGPVNRIVSLRASRRQPQPRVRGMQP
jgi:hypothetical protein